MGGQVRQPGIRFAHWARRFQTGGAAYMTPTSPEQRPKTPFRDTTTHPSTPLVRCVIVRAYARAVDALVVRCRAEPVPMMLH